mmetsp:Transcript_51178/g.76458  ORF Transcript_51178/g.76458 Transcript_51178/m.76458 type:complete len:87 (+) Transcript_51178:331-591(+)
MQRAVTWTLNLVTAVVWYVANAPSLFVDSAGNHGKLGESAIWANPVSVLAVMYLAMQTIPLLHKCKIVGHVQDVLFGPIGLLDATI